MVPCPVHKKIILMSKRQCSFHNGGLKVYDFNFSLRRSASTAAGVSGALPTPAGGRFEEIEQDMPSSTTQEPSVAIASSAGNLFANHIFCKVPADYSELHKAIFAFPRKAINNFFSFFIPLAF